MKFVFVAMVPPPLRRDADRVLPDEPHPIINSPRKSTGKLPRRVRRRLSRSDETISADAACLRGYYRSPRNFLQNFSCYF